MSEYGLSQSQQIKTTPQKNLMELITPQPSKRYLLIGGTGTGKSTLANVMLLNWKTKNPKSILIILDSKPRWRGELNINHLSAKSMYRGMTHGETFPDSMVVSDAKEFDIAWKQYRKRYTIIVQNDLDMDLHGYVANYVYTASKREKTPILVYVDETMDHFQPSTQPRSKTFGYAFTRICRSGRELGIAAIFASQRTKSIPVSIVEEMSELFLFRLDFEEDLKRLKEMGVTGDIPKPNGHKFYIFKRENRKWSNPITLKI